MVKKVVLLVATLFILLTSVCNAFEQPNPNRWSWIASNEKVGCWIDLQTIRFERKKSKYDECYGHRFVTVWVQMYFPQDGEVSINKWYCDLDCEKYKFLSLNRYDSDKNLINSYNVPVSLQKYILIIPDTVGERIFERLKKLWTINNRDIY